MMQNYLDAKNIEKKKQLLIVCNNRIKYIKDLNNV